MMMLWRTLHNNHPFSNDDVLTHIRRRCVYISGKYHLLTIIYRSSAVMSHVVPAYQVTRLLCVPPRTQTGMDYMRDAH